jgi:hypothetical protein
MGDRKQRKVFVSYSHKDRSYADQIRDAILLFSEFEVWMDARLLDPGDHISSAILKGLKESAYYVLLISESSNNSEWVKREISVAFELAKNNNIAIVPFLLEKVEVPLEFRGLLYIDATKSFNDGLKELFGFFQRQKSKLGALAPQQIIRKGFDPREQQRRQCQSALRDHELGDLRFSLSEKLTLKDIRVLWFDVFNTKMEDDVFSQDKALCCLELLDRSSREDLIGKLIDKICRNHPGMGSAK